MREVKARMNDLGPEIAVVQFPENPQTRSGLQNFLLARIEIQEAQQQGSAGVAHPRQQLATRPVGDFAVEDLDFELRCDAGPGVFQRGDACLVFETQRKVQDEISLATQAEASQPGREGIGVAGLLVSQGRARHPPRPGRRAAVP